MRRLISIVIFVLTSISVGICQHNYDCIPQNEIDNYKFYESCDAIKLLGMTNGGSSQELFDDKYLSLTCINPKIYVDTGEVLQITGQAFKGEGPYDYSINFSDSIYEFNCSSRYFSVEHLYRLPGVYRVKGAVENSKGERSVNKTCSIVYVAQDSVFANIKSSSVKEKDNVYYTYAGYRNSFLSNDIDIKSMRQYSWTIEDEYSENIVKNYPKLEYTAKKEGNFHVKLIVEGTLNKDTSIWEVQVVSSELFNEMFPRPKIGWGSPKHTLYNKNRQISQKGIFKEGVLWEGKWYKYDDEGRLSKIEIYKDGKYVKDGVIEE